MTPLDHLCSTLLLDQYDTWDQPNRMFLIHRTTLGLLTLVPLNMPERLGYIGPADQLNEFVIATCQRLLDQGGTVSDATRGVAVMYEAWEAPPSHAEELWRRHQAGGSTPDVADIPGRCEVRMLWARTTDGPTRLFRMARANTAIDQVPPNAINDDGEIARTLDQTMYILDQLRDPAHTHLLRRLAQQGT